MNINVTSFVEDLGYQDSSGESLADQLKEHMEILGRSGRWTPTGEVALLPADDPELAALGVLRVWIKTAEGVWVYISPTGQAVEAACPIGD